MTSQPVIPPLLIPYLSPPEESLVLFTGTLGATTNWLIFRVLAAFTSTNGIPRIDADNRAAATRGKVVLLSWLQDVAFWKEGAKKLSIDFQNVTVVDILGSGHGLGSDSLPAVEKELNAAIEAVPDSRSICLVLDGLDFLLAATACDVSSILNMIYGLREKVRRVILTVTTDAPLLHSQSTPLETSHCTLAMSLAHQAHLLMSLRELDSGAAKDVSGVLRITRGGQSSGIGSVVEERECLYFIGANGGAKVFDGGSGT